MDLFDKINLNKEITCFYGEAGTGKTNICHFIASKESEKGKVIFIDAENTFSSKRILEFNPDAKLENIIILKPTHFFNLHKLITNLFKIKDQPSMIILDSINRFYRKRISIDERTNKYFAKQLRILTSLSNNKPIIITAQVYQKSSGEIMPVGGNMLKNFCPRLFFLQKREKRTIIQQKPLLEEYPFEIMAGSIRPI